MPTRIRASQAGLTGSPAGRQASCGGLVGQQLARALRVWGDYARSPTLRPFLAEGRRAVFKRVDHTSNARMHRASGAEERVYRELEPYHQTLKSEP